MKNCMQRWIFPKIMHAKDCLSKQPHRYIFGVFFRRRELIIITKRMKVHSMAMKKCVLLFDGIFTTIDYFSQHWCWRFKIKAYLTWAVFFSCRTKDAVQEAVGCNDTQHLNILFMGALSKSEKKWKISHDKHGICPSVGLGHLPVPFQWNSIAQQSDPWSM